MGEVDYWQDPARQCFYVSTLADIEVTMITDFISSTNLTVSHSPSRVNPEQLPPLPPSEEVPPEKIDASIDKWFFISGAAA